MSGGPHSSTFTASDEPPAPADRRRCPHLFLVLESQAPLASPVRIRLDGLDQVTFGRGAARAIAPTGDRAAHTLAIRLADPWLSTSHARITRVMRRWVLEDLGSKNGTFVDGVRQARAEIEDGQIIEIGHTFFLFREALEHDAAAPPVLDAGTLAAPARALRTLLPELDRAFARLVPIARSVVPVLIEGETGTGKEVLARDIHALSARPGEIVAVNCGAIPANLVERELFGSEKSAFTGAGRTLGLVRAADRGTLLLDEIGDLPLPAQAALLRVLQQREVLPLGSERPVRVDLRVVAATHRPLDRMVEAGTFRADLLARLAGHRVELPPLRARREDLGLLIAALLRDAAAEGAARVTIHPRAARALLCHGWPGNVRELEKCLTTALVLAADGRIGIDHLPGPVQRAIDDDAAAKHDEDDARRAEIEALLREHGGNVTAVARAMGKARMQLQRWLKRYGIDPASFRRS